MDRRISGPRHFRKASPTLAWLLSAQGKGRRPQGRRSALRMAFLRHVAWNDKLMNNPDFGGEGARARRFHRPGSDGISVRISAASNLSPRRRATQRGPWREKRWVEFPRARESGLGWRGFQSKIGNRKSAMSRPPHPTRLGWWMRLAEPSPPRRRGPFLIRGFRLHSRMGRRPQCRNFRGGTAFSPGERCWAVRLDNPHAETELAAFSHCSI